MHLPGGIYGTSTVVLALVCTLQACHCTVRHGMSLHSPSWSVTRSRDSVLGLLPGAECVRFSACPFVCPLVCLSVCLFVRFPAFLLVCLSARLLVCFVCFFAYLLVCLSACVRYSAAGEYCTITAAQFKGTQKRKGQLPPSRFQSDGGGRDYKWHPVIT